MYGCFYIPFTIFTLTVHFSLSKMCEVQSMLITIVNNWWVNHEKINMKVNKASKGIDFDIGLC